MSAFERIEEIEKLRMAFSQMEGTPNKEDFLFLIKALGVMGGIAEKRGCTSCLPGMFEFKKRQLLVKEFEERMNEKTKEGQ